MKYYGKVVDNPEAKDYGKVQDLGRVWEDEDEGDLFEKWADGKWEDWPELIRIWSGQDHPFLPLPESKAVEFMAGKEVYYE